jgi:phosphatidate cytidylyltransferase
MHRRGRSGFLARLWVWFAVIPVFLGAAWLGPVPFGLLLAACGGYGLWEGARLEIRAERPPLLVMASASVAAAGPLAAAVATGFPAGIAMVLWLAAPWVYYGMRSGGVRIVALALYLAGGLAAWPLLLAPPAGYRFVLVAFSVVTVADILAYVAGRLLPPVYVLRRLSPGKTLAGFLAGAATAVAVAFILRFATPEQTATEVLIGALVLAVSGATGDLVASGIKRQRGVKDFGRALGRMGGLLDRVDSLLGAGWAYLLYLALLRSGVI